MPSTDLPLAAAVEPILKASDVPRVAPLRNDVDVSFWTGGADGRMRITRCRSCGLYLHPPQPVCRRCFSTDVSPAVVSGRGQLASYTINRHVWAEGYDRPYVVVLAQLDEQDDLLVISNLIGCRPSQARVGLPVEVEFVSFDGVWLPLFHPLSDAI